MTTVVVETRYPKKIAPASIITVATACSAVVVA